MRVTISIGGAFPSPYQYAEFLEREGHLERVVSFMPRSRLRSKLRVTLPDERLVTLPWIGATSYALSRLPLTRLPGSWWVSEVFDSAVQKRLGTCDVFNGWSGAALRSMRGAKALGAATILCTGSVHLAYQKELLEAEYGKWGVKRIVTDARIIEKGTQEFLEADHCVVPSAMVMQSLVDNGIAPCRVSIVAHPLTRHLPKTPKEDNVFRVIAVGRLELRKGIQYLLEAMRRLQLPNSELLLVGSVQDEFAPILREYAGHYRLARRASDEELGRFYSQSSVLVLASVEDGWGHVTLEAMSCGLPVIVSAGAGSADAVENGVNGFVVRAGDAAAIMEKLEFLYRNPDRRGEMGHLGGMLVKERTPLMYGQRMRDVFASVLSKTGPAGRRVADRGKRGSN